MSWRRAAVGFAALSLLLLAGCSSVPVGRVQKPEVYPDRATPDAALATYLWAWHSGDLDVLDQTLGAWLHKELRMLLKKQKRAAVVTYYKQDAEDLALLELEWTRRGEALAYARAKISTSRRKRIELDLALLRRPDGWVVTGNRPRQWTKQRKQPSPTGP